MMYRLPIGSSGRGAAVALAFGLAACSMHPLPEDVSPASTYDIVARMRCEVAEGLKDFPRNKKYEKIVNATHIGYDFAFIISEENKALNGRLEFKRPSFVDNKGFFLDLSASAAKTRANTRKFRILEKLSEVEEKGCWQATKLANPLYPITGATGMGEVVRTYVRLEMLTDLERATPEAGFKDVFVDELEFTTILTVGAMPKLELSTVVGSFKLAHTSFMGEAKRTDRHFVTIALSRDVGEVDLQSKFLDLERMTDGMLDSRPLRRLMQKRVAGARNRVLLALVRRELREEDRRLVNHVLFGTD